jgi:hypothetical protein
MQDAAEYDAFVRSSPQGTVFAESWWLDAVAPGRWRPNEVRAEGAIAAVWPTVVRRTRLGDVHGGAPMTPWLGPMFAPGKRGYRQRSTERERTSELLERIGPYAHLEARCSPNYDYWAPLHWHGFTQTTRYTWRIEDTSDLEALFENLYVKSRGHIRRAERNGIVVTESELAPFLDLHARASDQADRSGTEASRAALRRVDPAAAERGARTVLLARDEDGRIHGGGYFAHDERTTYYIAGATDTTLRSSAAGPLVIWKGIELASARGNAFDFEGTMLEPVEPFFRAFGGWPAPFSVVRHTPSAAYRNLTAAKRLAHAVTRR